MSVPTTQLALDVDRQGSCAADRCPTLTLLPVPVSEPPYDDEPVDGRRPRPVLVSRPAAPTGPLRDSPP